MLIAANAAAKKAKTRQIVAAGYLGILPTSDTNRTSGNIA
jgi:hypothetical protein